MINTTEPDIPSEAAYRDLLDCVTHSLVAVEMLGNLQEELRSLGLSASERIELVDPIATAIVAINQKKRNQ